MSWAMDELEARAARQLDGLRGFDEKLQAISARVTSVDGLVTVEVDAKGALVDLRLEHGANELGAARLGEAIVTTSALAAQKGLRPGGGRDRGVQRNIRRHALRSSFG